MFNKLLKIVKFEARFFFIVILFQLFNTTITAHAETQFNLSNITQNVIVNNSEIQSGWHQYQQLNIQKNSTQHVSLMQMLNQGFTSLSTDETSLENKQLLAIRLRAEQLAQQFLIAYLDYLAAKKQLSLQQHAQYSINLMNEIVLDNNFINNNAQVSNEALTTNQNIEQSKTLVEEALAHLKAVIDHKFLLSLELEPATRPDFLNQLAIPIDIKLALNRAQNNTLNFSDLNLKSTGHLANESNIESCKSIQEIIEQSYQNIEKNKALISMNSQSLATNANWALTHQLALNQENLAQLIANENTQLLKKQVLAGSQHQLDLNFLQLHSVMGDVLNALGLISPNPTYSDLINQKAEVQRCVFTQIAPAIKPSINETESQLRLKVNAWIQAWQSQSTQDFFSFYSPNFKPSNNSSLADWRKQRSKALFITIILK